MQLYPYATKEQFLTMFPNTEMSEQEIQNQLEAASVDVDGLTFNRITACGFDRLTAFQQDRVQRAVCQQADFRFQNADLFDGVIQSYSLNGASVTFDKDRIVTVGETMTSSSIYAGLKQSGLCCRRL